MRKQKDAKIGSPQWVAAWKRILSEGFIMRCILEPSLDSLRFWMESFLVSKNVLYQIRLERFSGDTIALPRVYTRMYGAPVETLLAGLEHFWIGTEAHNYLTIRELALAVPHRGFIRPFGISSVFLLPTNNPNLMTNYGAIREWMRHEGRKQMLLQDFERRFKAFLYRQEISLLKNTIGEVVSTTERETL